MVQGKQSLVQESVGVEKPWWNRPLIGRRSLVERITDKLYRKPIPDETLKLHEQNISEIKKISNRIRSIDHEKFGNEEFLTFAKIKFALNRGEWGYSGFEQNIELLKVGIKAHKAFLGLEQVEFTFQGRSLGDMYDYVSSLCINKVRAEVFQRQVKGKFVETYPKLKTEEGKQALELYVKHLDDVSAHQLSLNLLYAFRQYKMQNYAIFKTIADMIRVLRREELMNFEALKIKVIEKIEIFESLSKVIGIPDSQATLNTYAQLLQYASLVEKHQTAFAQFQQMVVLFEEWKTINDKILILRQVYPSNKFKIPKEFKQEIPGSRLYQKYRVYFE